MTRPRDSLLWGVPVVLAWAASCWAARQAHGHFVPRGFLYLVTAGALPVLVLALLQVRRGSPWSARLALLALVLGTPLVAVRTIPGIEPLQTYPIPGRPALALSAAPDGDSNLFLVRGDQHFIVKLTDSGMIGPAPALSPDGDRILFTARERGVWNLHVMELGTRATVPLSSGSDNELLGASPWSPDGKRIAFTVQRGDRYSIWVLDLDSGKRSALTEPELDAAHPAWSPDGTRLAYEVLSEDRTHTEIWTMSPAGGERVQVFSGACNALAPSWSPDGAQLAFSCGTDNDVDVYVTPAHRGAARNLTPNTPGHDVAYRWAPDGQHVLFVSDRAGGGGNFLYFVDFEGRNVKLAIVL